MKPLRVCFLWHQHQPYYRKGDKFILPWVRFHAIKDYLDLPSILDEFPSLKQTFNIVPSLLLQLNEYTKEKVSDRILELSLKHPSELTFKEKEEIARQFFVCNFQNLISPYPRYLELYNKVKAGDDLNEQDWIDLQVWYNLAWTGQLTRQRGQFQRYFLKERGFTQKEKEFLLAEQMKILEEIVPNLIRLYHLGQIELSVSPFFHPILPLLCDNSIAKVGLQNISIPEPEFRYPEDAKTQIAEGKKYFEQTFGFTPKGLWPSEGSLSTDVLNIILNQDFTWTATDSKLLYKTIGEENNLFHYFPFVYENNGKKLVVFFRDSFLSDAIGFTYQSWRPEDAVMDFVNILKIIRERIINTFGEDSLSLACVPIILDGENCWEYYKDNGLPFLRNLYHTLLSESSIKTMTFSEVVDSLPNDYPHIIKEIYPGSWINANFYTWIGQPAKQIAWSWLAKTRQVVEKHKDNPELYQKAMKLVLVAEGSDWFWWYGDDNIAPNKDDFDKLFRWYLSKIYELLGEETPEEFLHPLDINSHIRLFTMPTRQLTESNKTNLNADVGWGLYLARSAIGTMHSNKAFISEIYFGNTKSMFLIGIKPSKQLGASDRVSIYFTSPKDFKVEFYAKEMILHSTIPLSLSNLFVCIGDSIIFGVDFLALFGEKENYSGLILEFLVQSENELGEMNYPIEGSFTYIVV